MLFHLFCLFLSILGRNGTGDAGLVAKFLGLLQLAVDGGRREAGLIGNLADSLVLGLEVDEFLQVFSFGEFILLAELGGFLDVVLEDELRVALDLLQLVEDDVVGVVLVLTGADLDLLDIAPSGVFGGAADGDSGVEEVDELGTAGQVVLRHRGAGLPFRGVADDDQGEAVETLEIENLLHEGSGGFAFLGVIQEEGDVVHEDVPDAALLSCCSNAVEDSLLQAGIHDVFRAEFSPEKGVRETVDDTGLALDIAHLELLGAEFAVKVKHDVFAGDGLGHLRGEDGLAGVGCGDDDCAFAFDQQVVEVALGVGFGEGVIDPLVGAFDGHDADFVGGTPGFFGFSVDSGYWICCFLGLTHFWSSCGLGGSSSSRKWEPCS